ncbi:hypothetical protein Dip510_001726 [Elusimicrobium posterum]|uniref:hypothetical protein n=1 Tax=Elusimicrobium posterum TaxID=3116653 RepID=UPI003C713787
MFYLLTRKVIFVCLMFLSSQLCALNIEKFYIKDGSGNFNFGAFGIFNVDYENGKLIMPLQRDEYKNITILDKNLMLKMAQCFIKCETSETKTPEVKLVDLRPAGKIFIADVSFDNELLITFLVIKNKDTVRVSKPEDFIFNDKNFETNLKNLIKDELKLLSNKE